MHRLADAGAPVKSIYTIGYVDATLGIREMPLPLFIADSDVPPHKIMLFKESHSEKLIWDRKSKFTLF
jgi:hypothetical protein